VPLSRAIDPLSGIPSARQSALCGNVPANRVPAGASAADVLNRAHYFFDSAMNSAAAQTIIALEGSRHLRQRWKQSFTQWTTHKSNLTLSSLPTVIRTRVISGIPGL